jgi:hypothetical protein
VSPLWRSELRVGFCPDRLVTAQTVHRVQTDGIAQLKELAKGSRLCVVLSNHLVRYAVLPWNEALASKRDWEAYARHTFETTYGTAVSEWRIRACGTGRRAPRVACAVDGALIDSLRAIPGVVSIQPYLMTAFNARRAAFGAEGGWFVLHEEGRLALALIGKGGWRRVRVRQAAAGWPGMLADLLERELAGDEEDALGLAFACTEDELPARLGRFQVVDLSLSRRGTREGRDCIMALH